MEEQTKKEIPVEQNINVSKRQWYKKKIILIIAFCLVVAGVIILVITLSNDPINNPNEQSNESNTSTEPENSSTPEINTGAAPLELKELLSSERLGLSVSYPEPWQTQESSNDVSTYHSLDIGTKVQEGFGIAPGAVGLYIAKFEIGYYMSGSEYLSESTDLEYFARGNSGLLPEEEFVNYAKEERQIAGKTAIRYVRKIGDGMRWTSWFVKVTDGIYQIKLFNVRPETDEATMKTLENMLQTLQFI